MDEAKKEELYKIKAIAELMMNQDCGNPVEFSAGVINVLGRQIHESLEKILE